PVMDRLAASSASTRLYTHGPYVGLPGKSDIGGSEVGHMTMGAGKIVSQGPTRIKNLIATGELFRGDVMRTCVSRCLDNDAPLHLLGLLSDGNVHSHIDHFEAVIRHAEDCGIRRVHLHALLDGRDVAYQSAEIYLERMEALFREINGRHSGWDYSIASGGGREVITMDRDNNWDKVKLGWDTHVLGQAGHDFGSAGEALAHFRAAMPDAADQDLPPFVIKRDGKPVGEILDGHVLLFMNFRGDRAMEFSRAMLEEDFKHFDRVRRPRALFAGMSVYDEDTDLPPLRLATPPAVENPFGRRLLDLGLRQFRLAETQKYAHVTFFFNGGYREPLDASLEDYLLIPSDKIASFAQAPRMKAHEIAARAVELIKGGRHDFGLINFANADMVGHTGDFNAVIKAVEAVDAALGEIVSALEQAHGIAIITADHGNADEMLFLNPVTGRSEPNTKHSINPVPALLYDPARPGGPDYTFRVFDPEAPLTLANLAATLFILLGLEPPPDMEPSLFQLE
ncbi:MAG: 2,3-bisphosphoglycerate-independent phosphoglycerate mutase, partial [Deltaproteobacteria bacterium]|nr:2,3-bisphosphoglycerate-independent phosphoglycerate mutase [Deltaproteobacteria bacterium]